MNQPKKAALPPFNSLFSQVLSPPVDKQEAMPVPEETRQANVVMRPHGRAQPFPRIGLIRSPICMPRAPMQPVSSPAETVVLMQSPASAGFYLIIYLIIYLIWNITNCIVVFTSLYCICTSEQ